MESLSRPFHRRKLSNANSFSGKNAYDGVLSGHRPKFDGVPVVKLEEYREIFSTGQADSSIPVLDVSALEESESSDGFSFELGSMKPDYGKIFGGFCDEEIAVSYEELLARDKARAPLSTSPSSQDSGDSSYQSSDAMKQFNLSYNKISQRNKDGLDGTTHVAQLHAVPGFTCFIDEETSQLKKEKKLKSSVPQHVHPSVNSSRQELYEKETLRSGVESRSKYRQDVSLSDGKISETLPTVLKSHPSKVSSPSAASIPNNEASSQPKKETEKQKFSIGSNGHPSVNSSKQDFLEKAYSSQRDVESRGKYHQDELLSDDRISEKLPSALKSHPSSNEAASQAKKETEKQKSSISSNVHSSVNSSKRDFLEEQTSKSGVESRSRYHQGESLSDDRVSVTNPTNLKSHPSKVSSPSAAPVTNNKAASQPNKEYEKEKSSVTNNIHPSVNSSKWDFLEKETSRSGVESRSKYHQDESLSGDRISKTFAAELKSHPSRVSSLHAASVANGESASQPKRETEKQNPSVISNDHPSVNFSKQDFPEKQTSQSGVQSRSQYCQDESISDDRNSKAFQADIKLHPSEVFSAATNVENHKEHQKESTATNAETCNKSATPGDLPQFCFSEELDVNSAAAASAAALRKAIEKAQESIRMVKESVGRKKEGIQSFSNRSFKDSLKVKVRAVNVSTGEEQKEKHNKLKETLEKKGASSQVFSNTRVVFPDFADGEKLFGAKKVIDEIHGKILDSAKKSEIPPPSSHGLRENKMISDSKEVVGEREPGLGSSGTYESATRSSEVVEYNTHEAPKKDNKRPNVFPILESCEKNLGDTEDTIEYDKPRESFENKDEARPDNADKLAKGLDDLTVYQKVEDETKMSEVSDQIGHNKSFSEAVRLLENKKQEFLEREHDEKVAPNSDEEAIEKVFEDEKEGKENTNSEKEDTREKFYDVSEMEMIKNAQTCSLETNEVSPKEDYEMKEKEIHKSEETCKNLDNVQEPEISENSSSNYDDAEGSESVYASSSLFGQSDNNVESSEEVDDVSSSSSSAQVTGAFYEFQVEDTEAIESEYMSEDKEIFENLSADQTASEDNEDECETKSDDLSNHGLAEVEENEIRSESSLHMIRGMEIEVKEYNEREGTVEEMNVSVEEEESNLQQNHEGKPETQAKIETETSQEPKVSNEKKDETKESGPSKVMEKEHQKRIEEANAEERERERNRLAVERVIREARERAFAEARERAGRAAVERATTEVRQRVMADAQEKVAKASVGTKPSDTTSAQSKLRAERAAVERATAEARQRALEKAMSQKKISEPRVQVNEIRHTSSSDLHISNGTSSESAQRIKAKLEKHNRIMERAAKALAEKEKRDMLAQKEQAERSRLAENLDADIKRWSSGKEGNLRALLSTLQYILGADSGWQPVSLTEIITTSAVKKAYRKATLCVHPDKLQQRGASIQQKYICEKVFDLLKAAWNRFNSEER